jgi:hypothetical protein
MDSRRLLLLAALCVFFTGSAFAQQAPQQPASNSAAGHATGAESGSRSAGNSAPPAHPITLEQTKEMFQLMHFHETMLSMLHANLQAQRERAPFVPEDVWQDFETSFGRADFIPVFLPVYRRYLSEEDAARALDFYRTPAGQHVLAVMPPLMQDVATAAQAKGEEIAQEVFERHHDEIEAAQKKFNQQGTPPENPPAAGTQPK